MTAEQQDPVPVTRLDPDRGETRWCLGCQVNLKYEANREGWVEVDTFDPFCKPSREKHRPAPEGINLRRPRTPWGG